MDKVLLWRSGIRGEERFPDLLIYAAHEVIIGGLERSTPPG